MSSNLLTNSSPNAETGVKMPPRCARGVRLETLSKFESWSEAEAETVGRRKQRADSAIITERETIRFREGLVSVLNVLDVRRYPGSPFPSTTDFT